MTDKYKVRFFNIYDGSGELREQVDRAAAQKDLTRSQLIRHAIRRYLESEAS